MQKPHIGLIGNLKIRNKAKAYDYFPTYVSVYPVSTNIIKMHQQGNSMGTPLRIQSYEKHPLELQKKSQVMKKGSIHYNKYY